MTPVRFCDYCKASMKRIEYHRMTIDGGRMRIEESWVCEDEECLTTVILLHEYEADELISPRPKKNGSFSPS